MIIDKLSNKTYTEHELRYLAQDEIARLYSPSSEANLQRKISGLALGMYVPTTDEMVEIEAYKNHLISVQTETAQASTDNQLLIKAIEYETAVIRLQRYEIAVGRPEQIVYQEDGETVDYIIEAVEPLPATVEQWVYDNEGNGTLTEVLNPLIVQDIDERSAAKLIIANATQDVIDLVEMRSGLPSV